MRTMRTKSIEVGRFLVSPMTKPHADGGFAAPTLLTAGTAVQALAIGDIDVVELYQVMVSLAFFNVSNRHTFGLIFKYDLTDPEVVAQRRARVVEILERYLRAP